MATSKISTGSSGPGNSAENPAEALALEIAETQPNLSVDQIVDQVRFKLKGSTFVIQDVKDAIEEYREKQAQLEAENELDQQLLSPVQSALRMLFRRGILEQDGGSEMYFTTQVQQNEQEVRGQI